MGRNGNRGLTTLWLPCLPWLATLSLLLGLVWPGLAGVAFAQGQPPAAQGGQPQAVVQTADAGLSLPGAQGETAALASFGSEIRFQLRLRTQEPVTSVLFLYQVDNSRVQNTAVPAFQPGTSVIATYSWRVANVLVPGSEVRYQWLVETAGGQRVTSTEQVIAYDDTRFAWREARDEAQGLTVYFPNADPQGVQAGAALLDEARKTQARLKSEYGLTLDRPLRIFAYSRTEDYASALATMRPQEPSLTVGADRIFILAPGGTSGMTTATQGLRREIGTALFVQKTRNAYAEPPRWLATGFSFVMGGENLSAENARALSQIAKDNKLLSLKTLGGNFPTNERDLGLAYAESVSAVQYITAAYGADKMRALLAALKEGSTLDEAMKKGLGVSLDQFETRWKNALKSGEAERLGAGAGAPGATRPAPAGDGGPIRPPLRPRAALLAGRLRREHPPGADRRRRRPRPRRHRPHRRHRVLHLAPGAGRRGRVIAGDGQPGRSRSRAAAGDGQPEKARRVPPANGSDSEPARPWAPGLMPSSSPAASAAGRAGRTSAPAASPPSVPSPHPGAPAAGAPCPLVARAARAAPGVAGRPCPWTPCAAWAPWTAPCAGPCTA